MFTLIEQVFIALFYFTKSLSSIANTPDHVKCISLNNQLCMTQSTLDLHSNEYIKGLCYYPFAVNLEICMGSCNMVNDLSNKVCVPNKTDLDLSVFNIITRINESKNITKTYIM